MPNKIFKALNDTSALFQTSITLTGNQKIVIDSTNKTETAENTSYRIFLESLSSIRQDMISLNWDFTKTYSENIANFYKKYDVQRRDFWLNESIDVENELQILYSEEASSYEKQYFNLLQYGVKPIVNYENTLRFFAPLWVNSQKIPKKFVILRKQKPLNGTSYPAHINDIIDEGELVNVIELAESNVFSILNGLKSDSEFSNTPLLWNSESYLVNGINVKIGKYEKIRNFADNNTFLDDKSILSENGLYTDLFRSNNLVCSNLVNFEFLFDVPVGDTPFELYDYFGFYCDTIEDLYLKDFDVDSLASTIHKDDDFLSITKKVDNSHKLTRDLLNSDIQQTVLRKTLVNSDFKQLEDIQTRKALLRFNLNPNFGDDFQLHIDDDIYTFFASNKNTQSQFKVGSTILETVENLITTIKLRLEEVDTYDFEFHITENDNKIDLTIDSNVYFDDVTLKVKLIQFSNSLQINIDSILIDFTDSLTIGDTISVINYTQNDITLIEDSNLVKLIYEDDSEVELSLESVLQYEDELYLKFDKDVVADSLVSIRSINFYEFDYATSSIVSYIPIAAFDKTVIEPSEKNIYNFDSSRLVDDLSILANNSYGNIPSVSQFISDVTQEYVTDFEIEKLYIKRLLQNSSEDTEDPYERLKESDIEEHAFLNKFSNRCIKWGSYSGRNAIDLPYLSNSNISYGLLSGLVSQSELHESYENLSYSWFMLGWKPRNYASNDYYKTRNYATRYLLEEDFRSETVDAYSNFLSHKIHDDGIGFNRINNWSVVSSRLDNDFTSESDGYVLFRGVEYLLPSIYIGYRFAVVLINSANEDPFVETIINEEFRTYTVLVKYAIADTVSTNLDNTDFSEYCLDRVQLYRPSKLDENSVTNVSSKLQIDISYPQLIANKKYLTQTYFTDIIDTGGPDLLYAITMFDLPDYFDTNSVPIGSTFTITSKNLAGDEKTIECFDVRSFTQDYLWARRILITDVNTTTVLLDTDNYTVLTDNTQAVNDFDAVKSTEFEYSIEYSITAKNGVDRFVPLKLENCVDKINSAGSGIALSEFDLTTTLVRWQTEDTALSSKIIELEDKYATNLLRYANSCVPVVQLLFYPKNALYNSKELANTYYSDDYELTEYCIRKIGSDSTLVTNINSEELPIHRLIGEVVYDTIDFKVQESYDSWLSIREYFDKNSFNQIPSAKTIIPFTSIVSTLMKINSILIDFKIDLSDGNYRVNIYEKMRDYVVSLSNFSTFNEQEIGIVLWCIFKYNDFDLELYDEDQTFRTEIQDIDVRNSNTTNNEFIVSGYIASNEKVIDARIQIKEKQ